MKNHSQTIFCDDFMSQRQSDELTYREFDSPEELAVWSPDSRILRVLRFTLRGCFAACSYVAHALLRIAKLIRWASQPDKKKRSTPKPVHHPGVVLEFVVFGFFVMGVAMSTLF